MTYFDLSYEPKRNDLIAEFKLNPNTKDIGKKIALESSTGTWTDVKKPKRIEKLDGTVFFKNKNIIKVAYDLKVFEKGSVPQLMSSIGGNIFGMKALDSLRLEDIRFPTSYLKSFKGPKYGLEDIRELIGVKKRPLVGTIVKPKVGLTTKQHAKTAYKCWINGLDLVKCDENLTSQKFNKFEDNIKETLKLKKKAEKETGEKKIYVSNVTGETKEMIKRAKMVKNEGGNCVMVDIITTGWGALQSLRNEDLDLIIHAHRAGHAMMTRGIFGMSMLTIAKLSRLIGVSQLHTGTANVGKMHSGKEETQKINKFLTSKWQKIKKTFPIASGGLHAGSVSKLVEKLGRNIIIQAGGGVHSLGPAAGSKSMRQAVEAIMKNTSLKEYSI